MLAALRESCRLAFRNSDKHPRHPAPDILGCLLGICREARSRIATGRDDAPAPRKRRSRAGGLRDHAPMRRRCFAQRGIRFGRVGESIDEQVPVPIADDNPLTFANHAIGGFKRMARNEGRYCRVRQRRSAFQPALCRRVDAHLHAFSSGLTHCCLCLPFGQERKPYRLANQDSEAFAPCSFFVGSPPGRRLAARSGRPSATPQGSRGRATAERKWTARSRRAANSDEPSRDADMRSRNGLERNLRKRRSRRGKFAVFRTRGKENSRS